jgi:hypothetical protein
MSTNFSRLIACGLFCLTMVLVVRSVMAATPVAATTDISNQSKLGKAANLSLESVLSAGLKCRRPVEFDYIKKVAKKVDNGTLPHALVESTFFWARRQHEQYPYISFRYALEIRAKKLGISI